MLRQAENSVKIEGILSEVDLKLDTFTKRGESTPIDCIRGRIKVRVEETIGKEKVTLEIPVKLFSGKITKSGKVNPSYESICKVMNEYTSIAAAGSEDGADRIRITGAYIAMNEWFESETDFRSGPQIKASFVQRIKKEEFKPCAEFSVEFVVGGKQYETDKDGVETGSYIITGVLPQYGGNVDVVPFKVINPNAIYAMNQYWDDGSTVKANGKINFTSTLQVVTIPVDFGDPIDKVKTISSNDLLITGGSAQPLEGDFAYNQDEIQAALNNRTDRLAEQKEIDLTRKNQRTAPAPARSASPMNFGF